MKKDKLTLLGGLFTALLSTVCCIVPLLLLMLGIGGSWMSNLTALEPYKPFIIAISISLLGFAYWQIFLKKECCEEGKICALPENKFKYKIIFWVASLIILSSASISYWAPLLY